MVFKSNGYGVDGVAGDLVQPGLEGGGQAWDRGVVKVLQSEDRGVIMGRLWCHRVTVIVLSNCGSDVAPSTAKDATTVATGRSNTNDGENVT
jgi:hypothetical protein